MDNTEEFKVIELCAGYAGISQGLKRVIPSLRTIVHVEIEAFACANLVAKMEKGYLDAAPIWTDIKTFDGKPFRDRVHLITGGYPCAPFSHAGQRKGKDDPRHLWPYIKEIVAAVRPTYCFFENVEGHITLGLSTVISDLEEMGYRTMWGIFSASEVGAPHQRKRVFILGYAGCVGQKIDEKQTTRVEQPNEELAHSNSDGREDDKQTTQSRENDTKRRQECTSGIGVMRTGIETKRLSENETGIDELADTCQQGLQRDLQNISEEGRKDERRSSAGCSESGSKWPAKPGEQQHDWEPPRVTVNPWNPSVYSRYLSINPQGISQRESDILTSNGWVFENETFIKMDRDFDGYRDRMVRSTSRIDELRLIGNGVVPATVEKAFITLWEKLNDEKE